MLPGPRARQYTGTYTSGFEASAFRPAGSDELWWLSGAFDCPGTGIDLTPADDMQRTPPVVLTVIGRVSRKGEHGHMGAYDRKLAVERTVSCAPVAATDAAGGG